MAFFFFFWSFFGGGGVWGGGFFFSRFAFFFFFGLFLVVGGLGVEDFFFPGLRCCIFLVWDSLSLSNTRVDTHTMTIHLPWTRQIIHHQSREFRNRTDEKKKIVSDRMDTIG